MADSERELEEAKRELAASIAAARARGDRKAMTELEHAKAKARRVAGGHSGRYTPPSTRRR